jgi:Acyl-CoA reductase (LuxC)
MIETRDQRRAAVVRIISAARKVAADESIVAPLVRTTGLSREGVVLALSHHLETNPTAAEIDALVDRASITPRVHVILSSNVFIGALRAIACARAASASVSVQASSREPVFAQKLIDAIADPAVFTTDQETLSNLREGEIHVYGRAETIAKVRARAPKSVVVRGHGPGIGVAYVAKNDSIAKAATAIARDVVPFDQRGCLSPRIVFVAGDQSRAQKLSDRLCIELAKLGKEIPRGDLGEDEAAESVRYRESMRFAGSAIEGADFVIGISKTIVVPPSGRHVHITLIESGEALAEIVKPIANYVTAVGTSDLTISEFFSHSVRISPPGQMQRPPFDGPVDLRAT